MWISWPRLRPAATPAPSVDRCLQAVLALMTATQRELGRTLARHGVDAHPHEVAALVTHCAVLAASRHRAMDDAGRFALARAVLTQRAGALEREDALDFLTSRLRLYDTALREDPGPAPERTTRALLEIVRAEVPAPAATAIGLLVIQHCGRFVDALERA